MACCAPRAATQIVKLNKEKDPETNAYLELLESQVNLGPIVDFCLVHAAHTRHVVTCSGAAKDGSLRVIRSGVSVEEVATIELDGCRGVWTLRSSSTEAWDKYLVQSYVGDTRVFVLDAEDDALSEIEIEGFDDEAQTLLCANMSGDAVLQVGGCLFWQ